MLQEILRHLISSNTPLLTITECLWCLEPTAADSLRARMAAGSKLDTVFPAVVTEDDVAVVSIKGVFGPDGWADVSTNGLIETLMDLTQMDDITGVMLNIDSPGGAAAKLQDAANAVRQLAAVKPVYSQIDNLGASAAYYVASGSTKVFATSNSDMIGSIGTRLQLMESAGFYEKIGMRPVVIDTGDYKSAGAPGTVITPDQEAHFQTIVDEMQQGFTQAVSGGRGLTGDALEAVTDGRIFLAERAQSLGLIDGVQSATETLAALAGTRKKEVPMSESTPTDAPKTAASYEDLQLIPGATSDFVCEALGNSWTLDKAMSTWMDRQNEQLAQARQEAEDAKKAAAHAASNQPSDADQQLADLPAGQSDSDSTPADPIEAWEKLVAGYMAGGLSREEATLKAGNENEDARFAYLEKYMQLHGTAEEARMRSKQRMGSL